MIYVPLCWVRKISKFGIFHIFADLMILASLIILTIFGIRELHREDREEYEYKAVNTDYFLSFVGMSIYAYEGVGVIIPVMDTCSDKKNYP